MRTKRLTTIALAAFGAVCMLFTSCGKDGGDGDGPGDNTYNVTVSVTGNTGGTARATVGGATVTKAKSGATVTIEATPATDYEFTSWAVTSDNASLSGTTSSTATFNMPEGDVSITAAFKANASDVLKYITDPAFKAYAGSNMTADKWDKDGNGMLSSDEAAAVKIIDLENGYGGTKVKSMAGLEFFTGLTELNCFGNSLTTLDVSANTKLIDLTCHSNKLTELDVSANTKLTYLNCGKNLLTTLDVSANTALWFLICYDNRLTTLDASKMARPDSYNLYCGEQTSDGSTARSLTLTLRPDQMTRWGTLATEWENANVVIDGAPVITAHPADQAKVAGETATFSVTATDATSYRWEGSTDGGNKWSDVDNTPPVTNGVTTASMSISVIDGMDGWLFRCKVSNAKGVTYSSAARLTILPSATINGVVWAGCNVAAPGTFANKPEDYGMFYQWDNKKAWPATGTVTDWNTTRSTASTWTEANDPCPAGWRVPTEDELNTLLDAAEVTRAWTTTPAPGYKFTDKISGTSIFLPAAGVRDTATGTLGQVGTSGNYWSSTPSGTSFARNMTFYSSLSSGINTSDRPRGLSVRCVKK